MPYYAERCLWEIDGILTNFCNYVPLRSHDPKAKHEVNDAYGARDEIARRITFLKQYSLKSSSHYPKN